MEIGLVFALLVSVFYGLSDVYIRRAVLRSGEAYTAVLMTLFVGIVLYSLVITITGQWGVISTLSGRALAYLMGAGILHYIGGRFIYYAAVRRIGANKSGAISRVEIPYAVMMGIIVLGEPITTPLVIGVLCIVPGVVLTSMERKVAGGGGAEIHSYRAQAKGIVLAVIAGLFWGTSGVFIKPALQEMQAPFVGVFISYSTAFVLMAGFLFIDNQRDKILRLNRSMLVPMGITGILTSCSNLFRFQALNLSPMSLVMPLASTHILYLLVFSFLLNRSIEVFTTKIVLGIVLIAAGTVIIFL